jgi:hypothetical protein
MVNTEQLMSKADQMSTQEMKCASQSEAKLWPTDVDGGKSDQILTCPIQEATKPATLQPPQLEASKPAPLQQTPIESKENEDLDGGMSDKVHTCPENPLETPQITKQARNPSRNTPRLTQPTENPVNLITVEGETSEKVHTCPNPAENPPIIPPYPQTPTEVIQLGRQTQRKGSNPRNLPRVGGEMSDRVHTCPDIPINTPKKNHYQEKQQTVLITPKRKRCPNSPPPTLTPKTPRLAQKIPKKISQPMSPPPPCPPKIQKLRCRR